MKEIQKRYKEYLKEKNQFYYSKLSVVYIGGYSTTDNISRRISWNEMFDIIAGQGIHVHLFPLKEVKINNRLIEVHSPLPNLELNKKMGEYCYGISLDFFKKGFVADDFLKTTIGNKIFSYLEVGIPLIVNDELEFMADIVRKYNCGVVINEKELHNLRQILEMQDYGELLKGVEKAREDYRMNRQVTKLIKEIK